MNAAQRRRYHAELWPAVCDAQGWKRGDDAQRRAMVTQCLVDIGVASEEAEEISSTALDEAQITALFCFLAHLAEPNHIGLSQQWDDCRADYVAYHKSKQADWWQRRAFGSNGGRRLTRNRFAGREKAVAAPFSIDSEPLTEKEADERLMTMRNHARKKGKAPIAKRTPRTPPAEHIDLIPAPPKPDPYACLDAVTGYDSTVEEPMPF